MKRKALTKEERRNQVVMWFAIRIQNNNEAYATPHEIARGLGLEPSTKFRQMLNGMVEDSVLEAVPVAKSGRYPGKVYMLTAGTYVRPRRTINLNARGRQAGQLELFS